MMRGLRGCGVGRVWVWDWDGLLVEEDVPVEGDVEALRMLCWEDVGLRRTYN